MSHRQYITPILRHPLLEYRQCISSIYKRQATTLRNVGKDGARGQANALHSYVKTTTIQKRGNNSGYVELDLEFKDFEK